ncbi:MAG: MBL fold metallo-hydrolase [Mycoplasmoidaceae bacterium]
MAKILINVIQTSSEGNCIILNDNITNLILDFGASKKLINDNFLQNNINKNNIAGILLTHSHIDHSRSIFEDITSSINIYAPNLIWADLFYNNNIKSFNFNKINIKIDNWIKIPNSNWKFKSIKTIHNAVGSVCYIIKNKSIKILYLTDSEYFEKKIFKGMTCYLIECNYGSYGTTNQHVMNKHYKNIKNHMNSDNIENFYKKYRTHKTKSFIIIHLSQNNKNNFEVLDSIKKKYENRITKIKYIKPTEINIFKTKI